MKQSDLDKLARRQLKRMEKAELDEKQARIATLQDGIERLSERIRNPCDMSEEALQRAQRTLELSEQQMFELTHGA